MRLRVSRGEVGALSLPFSSHLLDDAPGILPTEASFLEQVSILRVEGVDLGVEHPILSQLLP